YNEFVSILVDPRSSEPTAMISALCAAMVDSVNPSGEKPDEDTQRNVGVHACHRVIRHDAEATMEFLQAVRGVRLDHIEDAEENESDPGGRPPRGDESQRDEHSKHFIDHDRAGIDGSEVPFGVGRGPRAGG